MAFLKKIFLGLSLFAVIYLGGEGAQSNSLLMQGMAFVGLLIGLIILYMFARMVLRGLGCFMAFLILAAIAAFILYAFGIFNNGIGGVKDSFLDFIGTERPKQVSVVEKKPEKVAPKAIKDTFDDEEDDDEEGSPMLYGALAEEKAPEPEPEPQPKAFNPLDYPAVYTSVRVINGDTLELYGRTLTLFGIDAPEPKQTCADSRGRSYNCGQEAANWLKGWIKDNELECHIIDQNAQGNMLGTCSYGPYDLGAALVNAGWAVANTRQSDVYYPYELQAQAARRGLWQGRFYKPADWRKIQSRKATIKVIRPQKRLKGIFG